MKLELVSHTLCPYVHRAAAMMHEKGVPFERRYIDLKAKPDWFLAISPRGKVPVLLVDGQPLFESQAIIEFLDETHPPSLLGTEPFERARQRAWVAVADDLSNAQYRLFIAPSPEEQAAAGEALAPIAARYEEAIAGGVIAPEGFGLGAPGVGVVGAALRRRRERAGRAGLAGGAQLRGAGAPPGGPPLDRPNGPRGLRRDLHPQAGRAPEPVRRPGRALGRN